MTPIVTDQATVDRWLADGRWVEFAPDFDSGWLSLDGTYANGFIVRPPADWTEAPQCDCFSGYRLAGTPDAYECPDCGGSGKQRLAVQVPCPNPGCHQGHEMDPTSDDPVSLGRCRDYCDSGLITVACKGQRLAVQVPCDGTTSEHHGCHDCDGSGLVTVAWATVEWGPAVIIDGDDGLPDDRPVCTVGLALYVWLPSQPGWPYEQAQTVTLPPDVDPQTLIGQWARGGSIGATA